MQDRITVPDSGDTAGEDAGWYRRLITGSLSERFERVKVLGDR